MVGLGDILGKPEDSLKKDSAFTDNIFDNLNKKKQKSKDIYAHEQKKIFKIFTFFKTQKIAKSKENATKIIQLKGLNRN